jgi:type I restriction enzyme M protein
MLTDNKLKTQIDALWNRFWSGGISNPINAIEQMSYLIFLKRLEDQENARLRKAQRKGEKYKNIYERYIKWYIKENKGDNEEDDDVLPAALKGDKKGDKLKWSYWSQLPGEEMLSFVRDHVFHFLRNMGKDGSTYTQFMQDAVFIIPKASLLQEAVRIIEDLHISEQNADVQGDIYEYLLNQLSTSGKNGQFRTPRHIIRMITKMVDPKISQRICDPAAGTAGFLVSAYEYILEQNTSKDILSYDEEGKAHNLIGDLLPDARAHNFLKSKAINGFDNDSTMVRIGAMNLMLHGIDDPHFSYGDALSKSFEERNLYDVALANPPFKGSIDESDINARFKTKTKKTELLFLELIYDLLVMGGRAGVIVPDGVLFGTSNAHVAVRQLLVDHCQLQGIVSMPSGVFKPYAGVSTAVLLFTKAGVTDKVWFYDMQADGYSLDDKRQKIAADDTKEIVEEYKQWQSKGAKYKPASKKIILVDVEEIRKNKYDLSISRYKPVEYQAVKYDEPEEILDKLMLMEDEISYIVKGLKDKMK